MDLVNVVLKYTPKTVTELERFMERNGFQNTDECIWEEKGIIVNTERYALNYYGNDLVEGDIQVLTILLKAIYEPDDIEIMEGGI